MKLLRAIEQAFSLENEKCEILQEYVDDYETNVYRVKYFIKFYLLIVYFGFVGEKTLLFIIIISFK